MLEFMPCQAAHVQYIKPLSVQMEEYKALLTPLGAEAISKSMGLTAWHGTRCVGMAGVCQIWPGRADAWILLSEGVGEFIGPIVRKARYVLDTYPSRRIEIAIKASNVEGHRIAALLGFGKPEGFLRAYHPDGSDMVMYARIREWRH